MKTDPTHVPDGYMQDTQGRLVPTEMVKDIDRARDELVRELIAKALPLRRDLATYRQQAMEDIQAFVDLSAERFGQKLGGSKGNVTLLSFDGEYKIMRAIDDYLIFDERLQVAKLLIDECINEWAADSRPEIRTLINDAFQVDKTGRVNTNRVLSLRRLDIKDARWKKAMDAIGESLQTVGSKAYIRIYQRQADGGYKQLSLDVCSAQEVS
jgi:hypothetical protein